MRCKTTRGWWRSIWAPRGEAGLGMRNGRASAYCLILLVLVSTSARPEGLPSYEVRSYLDRSTAGWADKASDYAFEVALPGCLIRWNAVQPISGERSLELRRECGRSFAQQAPIHQAILRAIDARWSLAQFTRLWFGSFALSTETEWGVPIAVASAKSPDYLDYRRRYPNTRHNLNALFLRFARETDAYRPLRELFAPFGLGVELTSVEKVFAQPVQRLPIRAALRERGLGDGEQVIYAAGSSYFSLRPISGAPVQ